MDDLQQQINRVEDVMRGLNPAQDNTNISRSQQGKKKLKYAVPNPPMVIFTDGLGISVCKGCPKGDNQRRTEVPKQHGIQKARLSQLLQQENAEVHDK